MEKKIVPAWSVLAKEFYRNPTEYDLSYLPSPIIRKTFRAGVLHRLAVQIALKMNKPVPFEVAQSYQLIISLPLKKKARLRYAVGPFFIYLPPIYSKM